MSHNGFNSWQAVQAEVLRRIQTQVWKPGDLIPHEADLSKEFGCARATVNRALRQLAEEGLLDRKRRAGTRVAAQPARKAKLEIPILRTEIEEGGMEYDYSLLSCKVKAPPISIRKKLHRGGDEIHLHVVAIHYANSRPFACEDRWINLQAVPRAKTANFEEVSANEWLVNNIPFERGTIAFSANPASSRTAKRLECDEGAALFTIDRKTMREQSVLTVVQISFAPGYQMHAVL